MIVDTSALVAILFEEPEARRYSQLIYDADYCGLSVVSRVELAIVLDRQGGPDTLQEAKVLLRSTGITIEPVTLEQGEIALHAYSSFGRGRHPAALDFGDCFAYALAKSRNEALLFKGNDFGRTDVRVAL